MLDLMMAKNKKTLHPKYPSKDGKCFQHFYFLCRSTNESFILCLSKQLNNRMFRTWSLSVTKSKSLAKARLNFHKPGMSEAKSCLKGYFTWLNTTFDGLLTAHKHRYIVREIKVSVNALIDSLAIKEFIPAPYAGRLRKS